MISHLYRYQLLYSNSRSERDSCISGLDTSWYQTYAFTQASQARWTKKWEYFFYTLLSRADSKAFRLKLFYYRKKLFSLNKWLSPRKGNSSFCPKIASLLVGKSENILSRHQFSIWIIKGNRIWIVTVQTLKHTSLQKHYNPYPRSILRCESFDRMHINHQLLKNQE